MTALGNAPAHWKQMTIDELGEVRLGRQRSPKNHTGDQMQPYLRAANVNWYRLRPDDIQTMNFTAKEMVDYALRENDLLIVEGSGSATEVGKCALVPSAYVDHAFQNTLIRIRPKPGVNARWLMYRVNADAELGGFLALARGSGIFHLGSTRTAKWPVALPPLAEQHAIVERIERMSSHLDAVAAGLARLRMKQRDLERALYATFYREAVAATGQVAAGELLGSIEAGESFRCPGHVAAPNKPGVLKLGAVTWGEYNEAENKELPPGKTPDPRWEVRAGDLLIGRANTAELVGATALVRSTRPGLYLSDKTLRLVPRSGVPAQWIKAALAAPQARKTMSAVATGTSDSMRNISQPRIRAVAVPDVPADAAQRRCAGA